MGINWFDSAEADEQMERVEIAELRQRSRGRRLPRSERGIEFSERRAERMARNLDRNAHRVLIGRGK